MVKKDTVRRRIFRSNAWMVLIILLLFLIFFKECLWEWYYDIMEPIGELH